MKINLNQYVTVILSEKGVEILENFYLGLPSFNCPKPGDPYKDQIHLIMLIFGGHMLGRLPFESVEVDLSFENFKELDQANKGQSCTPT